MQFSDNLRRLRIEHQMTQEDLAKKSGVSTRMVQNYELGVSQPRLASAEKLAAALEINVDDLLGVEALAGFEIGEAHGERAKRDFLKYAKEFSALMAGGEIPEEDKTAAFLMIASAYNQATEIAKEKYTPKRYRKPRKKKTEPESPDNE